MVTEELLSHWISNWKNFIAVNMLTDKWNPEFVGHFPVEKLYSK